jgi:outer membrane protein assembly factor BamB
MSFIMPWKNLCCIALCMAISGSAAATDWPTFNHDNARTGSTAEQLKMPLQKRWVYSPPAQPKLAWPGPDNRVIEGKDLRHRVNYDDTFHVAVVGDRVYFGSSVDHQVRCVDLKTGRELWHFFTGAAVRLAPTVWEGQVFFGADDGRVYSLDAETGKVVWHMRAGPAEEWFLGRGDMISRWPVRTGVTIYDGTAYFAAGIFPHDDIFLYAVDARKGTVIWKRGDISSKDADRNSITPQGYLLANEQYLIVPSGRALPACFDRKTGKLIHHRTHSWRGNAGGVVGGTRAFLADGQIYASGDHHMLALDQKTGDVGHAYIEGKQVIVDGEQAYTITGSMIARLDRPAYAKASVSRLTVQILLGDLQKKLKSPGKEAEKLKDEQARKKKELENLKIQGIDWAVESKLESALLVAGDHLYVGGEGRFEILEKASGKKLADHQVDGEVRGMVAANGYLLVSTGTGKIYVYADAGQAAAEAVIKVRTGESPYPKDERTDVYAQAAEDILKQTGVDRGFCLVVGAGEGQLAFELAKRSKLLIYGVEADQSRVEKGRELLSQAGLYGHRVVLHQADLDKVPYSNYFANLIVSDSFLATGKLPGDAGDFTRHLKPLGGTVYMVRPRNALGIKTDLPAVRLYVEQMAFGQDGKGKEFNSGAMFVRGKLRGADNWSHQYGDPSNTASNNDQLVKGGLGVLWYGDPGPGKMVNRHDGAVGPVSVNGRLIVQGEASVMAYDAYNGMFLWEYENPKVFRTGVFQNNNASNLLASEDSVFIMEGNQVTQLDAATGKLQAAHLLPKDKQEIYQWGYVAYQEGKLFGTATIRKELAEALKRRGKKFDENTDAIFAIDVKTGAHLWTYQGKNIEAPTIALGPDRVFFIDSSISGDERSALLRQDMADLKKLTGEAAKVMEARLKNYDARMAVALNATTGKQLWAQAVDVTDCSDIGIGGGKLTLMYKDDVLVLCGANANGHYWKQFVSGEFKQRRMVALSAKDGGKLWSKDANYRHRPIIIGSKIIAEPWAFDLTTGDTIMRKHPVTGEQVPWSMYRPGHHCGMLTGAPNMLMFRSGFTGFYDLYEDSGTQHFAGHRLGCWINAIPANGLVMIPEAGAGCVCQFSIESTITLEPREAKQHWTIYSAVGSSTPVEHLAINMGAPGDRKDKAGLVWFSYPRPNPLRDTGLDLKLKLNEQFVKGGGYDTVNADWTDVETSSVPSWVFTSWAKGLKKFEVPLLDETDKAARYTVRLYFADLDKSARAGQRVFDVKIQGKTVLKDFDPAKDGAAKSLAKEFADIAVTRNLEIELVPRNAAAGETRWPVLSGLEVIRKGGQE